MKKIEAYKCDFCKKKLERQSAMIRHEDLCSCNPKNFSACSNCVHLVETTIDITRIGGEYGEPYTTKSKSFHCKHFDKILYPMIVVRKGLLKRYPETFEEQELMPNKCEAMSYDTGNIIHEDKDFEF